MSFRIEHNSSAQTLTGDLEAQNTKTKKENVGPDATQIIIVQKLDQKF